MAEMTAALSNGRLAAPSPELLARFGALAEAEGLIDVAYTTYDAPFGLLVLGGTSNGLVRLAFDPLETVVDDLSERISPRVLAAPGRFDGVRRQLDEYFAGSRRHFDVAIDLRLAGSAFRRAVLAAADAIPYGQVRSYGEVARSAGSPAAVRAVGSALGANPVCVVVPCHRVLRSDGSISGYAGGPERKDFLLRLEGSR
ncbi:MAG: methylated-DNA--[protein]-cysteine S-methyltransferase [Actinomycetota bacterium]